jgi:MinD-like ATPase involved in chromosome partitioning or flagellar assembly
MITFDDALATLVRLCEQAQGFHELRKVCAVRDLRGRLRLVVEPDPAKGEPDLTGLAAVLRAELGEYFVGPIWSTSALKEQGRLAKGVLGHAGCVQWRATYDDPITGQRAVQARAPWHKLERRLSKDAWLDASEARPPWELKKKEPGIATFYSFKGGVGRTTALVSCAWQLARAGKKVVVIDLDLEAPGLGPLLGAESSRGALDFLVEYLATDEIHFEGLVSPAAALEEDGERVRVISAGRLGQGYLEKLARLDYAAATHPSGDADHSPVERALRALLFKCRSEKPDYILIDARAGLHDLAGISLHRLAHVDVLVTRASEQAHQGFDLALDALARRKGRANLSCIVVHAMAPPEGLREAIEEQREVSSRIFESFQRSAYQPGQALNMEDPGPHQPTVLRFDLQLLRFASIRTVDERLMDKHYRALCERLLELLNPPDEAEE